MDLAELTPTAIDYIYANIDDSRLSKWEQGFVENTSDKWTRIRHLSDKEKIKLGEIWDKQG